MKIKNAIFFPLLFLVLVQVNAQKQGMLIGVKFNYAHLSFKENLDYKENPWRGLPGSYGVKILKVNEVKRWQLCYGFDIARTTQTDFSYKYHLPNDTLKYYNGSYQVQRTMPWLSLQIRAGRNFFATRSFKLNVYAGLSAVSGRFKTTAKYANAVKDKFDVALDEANRTPFYYTFGVQMGGALSRRTFGWLGNTLTLSVSQPMINKKNFSYLKNLYWFELTWQLSVIWLDDRAIIKSNEKRNRF